MWILEEYQYGNVLSFKWRKMYVERMENIFPIISGMKPVWSCIGLSRWWYFPIEPPMGMSLPQNWNTMEWEKWRNETIGWNLPMIEDRGQLLSSLTTLRPSKFMQVKHSIVPNGFLTQKFISIYFLIRKNNKVINLPEKKRKTSKSLSLCLSKNTQ
jgi:hypothetical protein